MMDRGRFIRPRVEYRVKIQVEYRILGEFLSIKVEFLLDSGNKSFYLTMTHKWSKTRIPRFDSTSIRHIRLKYRYSTRTRVE